MEDERPHSRLAFHRAGQLAGVAPRLQPGRQPDLLDVTATEGPATDGGPFVGQRLDGQPPTGPQVTDAVSVGNPDVGDEHLGEVTIAVDLHQRADLDARRRHLDCEHGQAAVLGQRGIGPGQAHAPPGIRATRGPHLGTVQDPLVAIALGPHARIGEIGSGIRLGEHLAPDLRTIGDGSEPPVLLGGGTTVQQYGTHEVQAHAVGVHVGHGVVAHGGLDHRRFGRLGVTAAMDRRPRRHHPPTVDHQRQEPPPGLEVIASGAQHGGGSRGIPTIQQGVQSSADLVDGEVHRCSLPVDFPVL